MERNNRIFKNNSRTVEDIVEIIVRTVSEWATMTDAFQGVFLDDLNTSWDPVLKGDDVLIRFVQSVGCRLLVVF